MPRTIIILGNGFDLDLGLQTGYSEFAKSPQWAGLMEGSSHSYDDSWLLGYLRNKYDIEKWIDIEASLLEYAKNKTRIKDFGHAGEDATDFNALCNALKDYLLEQQGGFTPRNKSVAFAFMSMIALITGPTRLYTFNYTNLKVLAKRCGLSTPFDAMHIHGSLSVNDDIILGIETQEEIDDHYSFLFKTQNRQYRHTNILKDLREKDELIFYGHSLNGMDYAYFRNTFSGLSLSGGGTTPRLTIITKDNASEGQFKNFLRKNNVSLQGLFSNAIPVFILTDLVYQGDEVENQKVMSLLARAKSF